MADPLNTLICWAPCWMIAGVLTTPTDDFMPDGTTGDPPPAFTKSSLKLPLLLRSHGGVARGVPFNASISMIQLFPPPKQALLAEFGVTLSKSTRPLIRVGKATTRSPVGTVADGTSRSMYQPRLAGTVVDVVVVPT